MPKSLLAAIAALCLFALAPGDAFAERHLAWNGKEINGWICDGKVLKPKHGATDANTWVFTGREIRPKVGPSAATTWIFNGRELRPKVGAKPSNTWIIDGNKSCPKAGANDANTWDVGTAPILVIAGALVLHLY